MGSKKLNPLGPAKHPTNPIKHSVCIVCKQGALRRAKLGQVICTVPKPKHRRPTPQNHFDHQCLRHQALLLQQEVQGVHHHKACVCSQTIQKGGWRFEFKIQGIAWNQFFSQISIGCAPAECPSPESDKVGIDPLHLEVTRLWAPKYRHLTFKRTQSSE